ncbi:MAG: hypothetical protein A2Z17_03400 [Gammaproteobacteria bacterium RBG_16_66_13]|nr:MAG: hypothetical protein A2Z17_03400 [Gammaproteobacteria bacterium RBG_16_66_13]
MPRYLLAHNIASMYEDQDEWVRDWGGLRKRARGAATWLASWYCAETNRLYCEWEAPDLASIKACFTSIELDMAPIASMEEVVHMDPAWLD